MTNITIPMNKNKNHISKKIKNPTALQNGQLPTT